VSKRQLWKRSLWAAGLVVALAFPLAGEARAQGAPFINFETIPTRALALAPDGTRLFATNTPDGRLEILSVTPDGLVAAGSVPVGLDPIAVAARSDAEVWVVNHLSDSVSIVDVSADPPRVVRTLLVGDEPRDVVFAGARRERAFITAARRGQNHPADTVAEQQRPGIGRADVWVFDTENLGAAAGGTPLSIVQLFGDKPGAMAVSPDASRVFVSIFTSGNETSVINASAVCGTPEAPASGSGLPLAGRGRVSGQADGPCALGLGGTAPGGVPAPNENTADGGGSPRVGVIVRFDRESGAWLDQAGRDFRVWPLAHPAARYRPGRFRWS